MNPLALWERARDSLWFIPGLMVLAGLALAPIMVQIDRVVLVGSGPEALWWLLAGSPASMRAVLSTIAGTLITVVGVVFSITIVALQLASTQYSPRVLQNFMSDRSVQVVLGVFLGTFTYSLLLLRTVYSPLDPSIAAFVPAASVTLAVLLALVSMGYLIYYIDHVSKWVEPSTIIDRVASDTLRVAHEHLTADDRVPTDTKLPEGTPTVVLARRAGYVQMVDRGRIVDAAQRTDTFIHIGIGVGRYALASTVLGRIWPAERADDELLDAVRGAFVFGRRRTTRQDLELGLIQLSDIAIKALSPAINDPTTATMSLDRISEVMSIVAGSVTGRTFLNGEDGRGSVLLETLDFEQLMDSAFSQVRRYGASNAGLVVHLLHKLAVVARSAAANERSVLNRHIDEVEANARLEISYDEDLERVLAAARNARRTVAASTP